MKITEYNPKNGEPRTLSISVILHLDILESEDPTKVAEQALQAYQDILEYGTVVGRGEWITAGEDFNNLKD